MKLKIFGKKLILTIEKNKSKINLFTNLNLIEYF